MSEKYKYISSILSHHPRGDQISTILTSAINAVEPGKAIRNVVKRQNDCLIYDSNKIDLKHFSHIYLIAIGKAAVSMGNTLADIVDEKLTRGWVVPKYEGQEIYPKFTVIPGGHPLPDEKSLSAGELLLDVASSFSDNDLVFCLISGGGSALVTAPYAGISLQDVRDMTRDLLACGARIDEINTLRRHLDRIKGGGLARAIAPAKLISLILSDVVNSPLETIASGPTAPDPSTIEDTREIIHKYQLQGKIPKSILTHFERQLETPKPGDKLFNNVKNILVGSNEIASDAAAKTAQSFGFHCDNLGNAWQGEAREVAKNLVEKLLSTGESSLCMIAGGETTVTLQGGGKGGRNLELALAAVPLLDGVPDVMLVTLATDGEDGPTDAAGAVVTGETANRAKKLGLDVEVYLDDNDSYHFFEKLGDLLKPGPTGTNVNDLTFLFRF
jgi:glycerate 2-kinase